MAQWFWWRIISLPTCTLCKVNQVVLEGYFFNLPIHFQYFVTLASYHVQLFLLVVLRNCKQLQPVQSICRSEAMVLLPLKLHWFSRWTCIWQQYFHFMHFPELIYLWQFNHIHQYKTKLLWKGPLFVQEWFISVLDSRIMNEALKHTILQRTNNKSTPI